MEELRELEARALLDPSAVTAFLEEHEFPHVEGTTVTFVYHGEADEVHLRHWIYGLPSSQPFVHMHAAPDLWFLILDLPEGSRMEYKLEVVKGHEHALIQDPLNPHSAMDPYGSNSVVYGTGYEVPEWVKEDPEARPGTLEEVAVLSTAFREARPVGLYLPARFRETRRYPLLVVHDGRDYLRFAALKTVLDNLIHRLEIPPLVAALIQSPNRLREYADDERHGRFLADELVPMLESRFPLIGTAAARCLMGASFGAVASLATAWRHPGFVDKLLLQSGSFAFTDIGDHDRGPVFDPVVKFTNEFRQKPGKAADKLFLSCGTYESLIYYNRSMIPLLQATGMNVRYRESRDGHNWENWRDGLREGLSWLFPGPLWMVYE